MTTEKKNKGGAPIGNQNAVKNRPIADALRLALMSDPKRLRKLADKIVSLAAAGDMQAMKELADRVDGKALQSVEISSPDGSPLHIQHALSEEMIRKAIKQNNEEI